MYRTASLTPEALSSLRHASDIRNVCLVGHELSDTLSGAAEQAAEHSAKARCLHALRPGKELLVNVIEAPSHPDFLHEVSAALRLADSVLFHVDSINAYAQALLRLAIAERVKPVLVLELDLSLKKDDLYQKLHGTIASVNDLIHDKVLQVSPADIVFGSGEWAFTLHQIVAKHSRRFDVDEGRMLELLWGDHYYDAETHQWREGGTERSFNKFCLEPLYRIADAVERRDLSLLEGLGITLDDERQKLSDKQLLDVVLGEFIPAKQPLLEMIERLQDPRTAQYRMEVLSDELSIRSCNPDGPLVVCISKVLRTAEGLRALGRVFSGTVRAGKVKIHPGNYRKSIEKVLLPDGLEVESMPAGSIVVLAGVDQFLLNSGIITTLETVPKFRSMPSTTIVQRSVNVKTPGDLPKLVEGLKLLSKLDSGVEVSTTEAGGHLIAGTGEVHLDACLRELKNLNLEVSKTEVQYRETVCGFSKMTALAKSPNKFNRIYMTAEPLSEDALRTIGGAAPSSHDFDVEEARIWSFGPDSSGLNVLVDKTRAVWHMNEIKESTVSGFQWATKEGPLAEEPLRSVRFNIVDVTLFSDSIHRGAGQIIPTVRRAVYASTLLAEPGLLEPVYVAEYPQGDLLQGSVAASETRLPVRLSLGRDPTRAQLIFDGWQLVPGSVLESDTLANQIAGQIRRRKGLKPGVSGYETYYDKL